MFYLLFGIISGIILSIAPIMVPSGAMEIYPEWCTGTESIRQIQASPNFSISKIKLAITAGSDIYLLSANGRLLKQINFENHLVSVSRTGNYYVQYDKLGVYIELFNFTGDRFWRIRSMEYPYITSGGKIIILMNGDHSRIRIFDINGNQAGAEEIYGRLCTSIAFSKDSDYSGIGFLDGRYFFLNDRGEIVNKGTVPDNSLVKGLAISRNGKFFIVHYGNDKGDFLRLIDSAGSRLHMFPLKNIHLTRTSIIASDEGDIAAIDYDRIIITRGDRIDSIIRIPPAANGMSSIGLIGNFYTTGYTGIDGRINYYIYQKDGTVIFNKVFSEENFIESDIYGNVILLRGSANLYCYSFRIPGSR